MVHGYVVVMLLHTFYPLSFHLGLSVPSTLTFTGSVALYWLAYISARALWSLAVVRVKLGHISSVPLG